MLPQPPPPPLRRVLAFGIDVLVIAAWAGLVGLLVTGAMRLTGGMGAVPGGAGGHAIGFVALTLPALAYLALTERSGWRATLGKRVAGLQVERPGGERLPLAAALLRSALRLLPWELSHVALWRIPGWPMEVTEVPPFAVALLVGTWICVAAWLWSVVRDPGGRTPWDRLAGTRVVRSPPPS